MKSKQKGFIAATLAVVVFLLFLFSGSVLAGSEIVEEGDISKVAGELHIPANKIVNGNVTLNLGELVVDGVVNGNVSSNMGQVTINGDVNGDVETNMGQIVIGGNVSGNVKTRMGELIVNGSVGGDISADLGSTEVSGTVGGNIGSGLGELTVNGVVSGHINSRGGKVVINGIVEGDVVVETGVVELKPGAIVSGNIEVSRGVVIKADTSVVGGSINVKELLDFSDAKEDYRPDNYYWVDSEYVEQTVENFIDRLITRLDKALDDDHIFPRYLIPGRYSWRLMPLGLFYVNAAQSVINMLILFALTALVYTLFPARIKVSRANLTGNIGQIIGWGALALILAVPITIVLTITIIGIPLILVQVLLYAGAFIFGYTCIAGYAGERIARAASVKEVNPFAALALGVLLFGLLCMIPILGAVVGLALFILSVGLALSSRFGTLKIEEKATVEPEPEHSGNE